MTSPNFSTWYATRHINIGYKSLKSSKNLECGRKHAWFGGFGKILDFGRKYFWNGSRGAFRTFLFLWESLRFSENIWDAALNSRFAPAFFLRFSENLRKIKKVRNAPQMSKIGKAIDHLQPLSRWMKKMANFGPLAKIAKLHKTRHTVG